MRQKNVTAQTPQTHSWHPPAWEMCLPAVITGGLQSFLNKGIIEPRGQGLMKMPIMSTNPSAESHLRMYADTSLCPGMPAAKL